MLDQGGYAVQYVELGDQLGFVGGVRRVGPDRLGGIEREATDEDPKPPKQALLRVAEQVVAPSDRVAHGLLAQGQVPRAATEQGEPLLQALQQRRRRQGLDACRGQLDRERETVDAADDLGDHRHGFGGGVEIRLDSPCTFDEEPDRSGDLGFLCIRQCVDRERSDREFSFARNPKPDATGYQQHHFGAGVQDPEQLRRGDDHLLEVVQHEEQAPVGDCSRQAIM